MYKELNFELIFLSTTIIIASSLIVWLSKESIYKSKLLGLA